MHADLQLSGHKKDCLKNRAIASGLAKHYSEVEHKSLKCLEITIIDSVNSEDKLKNCEDFWMVNLGTLNSETGLNTRDEVKSKSRIPNLKK